MGGLSAQYAAGQYHERHSDKSSDPGSVTAYRGVIVSFHGIVKKLTKKEILLQQEGGDQLMTIRCSKKTKYFANGKEVKLTDIDLDSAVIVDATEDTDWKMVALDVRVERDAKKNWSGADKARK